MYGNARDNVTNNMKKTGNYPDYRFVASYHFTGSPWWWCMWFKRREDMDAFLEPIREIGADIVFTVREE